MTPAEWKAKWPRHCTLCGGWGGKTFYQSHGPGPSEQMFDLCVHDQDEDFSLCHRCGENGLTEDGEGPCKSCGWDFDDGIPEEPYDDSDIHPSAGAAGTGDA